ncbi:MAG: Jag N-terminal domain-containing protein [Anaerolineae bacterium]|nr:Jag N-terminal domain-containing protein [Anaerolineae bacterium]
MSPEFIETTGETVEEAIETGLQELGVRPSDVIVEVLEEPVKGIMGLESRPARVRLEVLTRPSAPAASPTSVSRPYEEDTEVMLPPSRPPREPRPPRTREPEPEYLDIEMDDGEDASVPFLSEADEVPEQELDEEAAIARVVLGELLERMFIRGRIIVRRSKPDEQGENAPWILDVGGTQSNRLIGRRGETLAALQYVTRLITSRELQRRAEVIVDVGGYKARRAQSLHGLALRMAGEAAERGKVVAMEPMPPHERRIIHLALRDHADVTTKSVGEGPARKVTIVPRNLE